MKKAFAVLGATIALIIAAAVIIPFLIPMDRYKSEISAQVKKATGRDFAIAGKLSLSLFPNVGLTAKGISLSNPPASAQPIMASADELNISLKLMPLISGEIVVNGFELVHPVIHLEVDKAGQGNWVFQQKPKEAEAGKGGALPRGLSLNNLRLTDGQIDYTNAQTGKSYQVSAIDSAVSLPRIDGPLDVAGSFIWKGQKLALNFTTANLKNLMDGQPVAITAKVSAAPMTVTLKGSAVKAEAFGLDGDVSIDAPSLRDLAAWVSTPMAPGSGLGPLKVAGHINMADKRYSFTKATVRADNINARGNLDISTGDAGTNAITARLTDGQLDYKDAKTGKPMQVSAVNSSARLARMDGPLEVTGSLVWNRQKVALNFTTANLKSLMDGQPTAITVKANAAPMNFSLQGTAVKAKDIRLDGDISLAAPSLRNLAAWVSKPLAPGSGLGPLSVAGHFKMAPQRYVFTRTTVRLDNMNVRGNLDVATGGPGSSAFTARMTDGQLDYKDAKTGKPLQLSAINSSVSLAAMDGPLKLDGGLVWEGQKVALNFTTANIQKLMDGKPTAITTRVASTPMNFSLQGTATKAKDIGLDGDITLDVPSVRNLAAWVSKPLTLPGSGLGPLNIAGHLNMAAQHYAFTKAAIRLDNIRATGDLDVATGGPRIKASGAFAVDNLDLNPYLPPKAPKKASEWSRQPIDMSGLKVADLSFSFKSKSLQYRKIQVGASTLALVLDNGKLSADLKEMTLYGGTGKGRVDIDGSGAVPTVKATFDLTGVNAEPLLRDASDFGRLSGTLKTDLNIETRGRSQYDMVSGLNGKGAFHFANGTLKGVDIAAAAETIERISNGVKAGGTDMLTNLLGGNLLGSLTSVASIFGGAGQVDKSTKFTSLDATWTAKSGTVTNKDLVMIGPYVNQRILFKMTGAGDIKLPPQDINYEAEIRSFAKADTGGGIGGKVRLSGPLANPAPCVVLGSLCLGKNTRPGDLLKLQLKGVIPGLGKDTGEKPAVPSVDKLKDLLKGLIPKESGGAP